MFSTPVLSLRTSENQENTMRKNGPGKALQRKPFLDRPVNSKTPITKTSKEHSLKQKDTTKKQLLSEEDTDGYEYMFSFEDKEDNDCDIWPKPVQLGTEGIISILCNYCGNNQVTPPPSPINSTIDIDFIFTKLPEMDYNRNVDVTFESISDVEIPYFDDTENCS